VIIDIFWLVSEGFGGCLGQAGAFALVEGDVAGEFELLQSFHGMSETIAGKVHVRIVDLLDIPRQDDLAALTDPRENRLDLLHGQILGFIKNDE
jgi:hypothetical protein